MKKISIIAFFSTIAIIFLTAFGWIAYEIVSLNKNERKDEIFFEEVSVEDECTKFAEKHEETIQTMATEKKISQNAHIIFKTYYLNCKHTIQRVEKVPNELVNLNKDALENYYSDWKIKGFSTEEIVLYKEIKGFCDEHFKLKYDDKTVRLYKTNENGEEIWKCDTDINIEVLPDEDKKKLENGLTIIGIEEINKVIEDYE